jgi:hypothetical protein
MLVTTEVVEVTYLVLLTSILSIISSSTVILNVVVGPGEHDPHGMYIYTYTYSTDTLHMHAGHYLECKHLHHVCLCPHQLYTCHAFGFERSLSYPCFQFSTSCLLASNLPLVLFSSTCVRCYPQTVLPRRSNVERDQIFSGFSSIYANSFSMLMRQVF